MEGEQNPAQRPPDELRPIRTFQSDVEEVMKRILSFYEDVKPVEKVLQELDNY